jgi:vancomycin permeability regulator SanA
MSEPSITFGPRANQSVVSVYTIGVLTEILVNAKLSSCMITSTSRTPADQARIMFQNIVGQGVAAQKKLYAAPGRAVVDEFVRAKQVGKDDAGIISAMQAKIVALGPTTVSHHCADPSKLNVVDVAPSSVANTTSFVHAVQSAIKTGKVSKLLTPGNNDPAFHIEIPQPAA